MKTIKIATFATLFVLASLTGFAQSKIMYPIYSDVAGKTLAQKQSDTITNTATKTQTLAISRLHPNAEIHAKVRQISGTAAGYVILQVSNDGTNFAKVDSARIYSVASPTIQTKRLALNGSPAKYARISYTGVGTMSAELKSEFLTVKP